MPDGTNDNGVRPRDDLDEAPPPDPLDDDAELPRGTGPRRDKRHGDRKHAAPPAADLLPMPGAFGAPSPGAALPAAQAGNGPIDERAVREELKRLERWAKANRRDACWDRVRYWSFKLPALLCAAGTAVLQQYGYGQFVVLVGALSAVLVALDGLVPGGLLFKAHQSAYMEIRQIENDVATEWSKVLIQFPDPAAPGRQERAIKILDRIKTSRRRINNYLIEAEALLHAKPKAAAEE